VLRSGKKVPGNGSIRQGFARKVLRIAGKVQEIAGQRDLEPWRKLAVGKMLEKHCESSKSIDGSSHRDCPAKAAFGVWRAF